MSYYTTVSKSNFYVSTENTGRVLATFRRRPYHFTPDDTGNIINIEMSSCSFWNDLPINCPFWSLLDCPMRHPLLRDKFVYNYRSRLGNSKHCVVHRANAVEVLYKLMIFIYFSLFREK